MEKQKLCGSTLQYAEIIVDYKNDKTAIKGVPEESLYNRLKSAFSEWFLKILMLFIILEGIWQTLLNKENFIIPLYICTGILITLLLCHINKKFDARVRTWFVVKSGSGKRNKVKLVNLKTKELVLYNIKNIVLEYETEGDVKAQLNKIWIKEEHPSSILTKQANMEDMLFLEDKPVWNAHFIFEKIPKDGYLYVEWI